jgi:hypothetical protein
LMSSEYSLQFPHTPAGVEHDAHRTWRILRMKVTGRSTTFTSGRNGERAMVRMRNLLSPAIQEA